MERPGFVPVFLLQSGVPAGPMGDVRVPIKIRPYGIDASEQEQEVGRESREYLLSFVRSGQGAR